MTMSAERLAEIDAELAAIGKPDEELPAVIARARALAGSLGDLDAALEELGGDVSARLARGARRPASAERLATDTASSAELDRPNRTSDIAGLSVDELFADAAPSSGEAASGLGGLFDEDPALADVFESEHPDAATSTGHDSDGLADLLESDGEAPTGEDASGSANPPAPTAAAADATLLVSMKDLDIEDEIEEMEREAQAQAGAVEVDLDFDPPHGDGSHTLPPDSLPVFGEDDDSRTGAASGVEVAAGAGAVATSDEFELLVDEDMLEIDPDEVVSEEDEPPKAGLISRILGGRKR